MSKLIALVATAVMLDGVRTVIQPGQELPTLTAHDQKELVDSGAALDPAAEASTDKARQQEAQFAQQAFQDARKRVQAEQASTTDGVATSGTADAAAAEAAAAEAAAAEAAAAEAAAAEAAASMAAVAKAADAKATTQTSRARRNNAKE